MEKMFDTTAVSYTHLDVYKRQLLALTFNFTFCTSCQRSFLFSERVENNGFEPLKMCIRDRTG